MRDADEEKDAAGARALFERMDAEGKLGLTALSGLDLCALDAAARVPPFDPPAARMWSRRSPEQREEMTRPVLAGLERRGELYVVEDTGLGPGARRYRYSPELGVVMAARAFSPFVISCGVYGYRGQVVRLFAVGDDTTRVRGIAIERTAPAPVGHAEALARFGAFGCLYRYVLATRWSAAQILAEVAMLPVAGPRPGRGPGWWTVSMLGRGPGRAVGDQRLFVRGEGSRARVRGRRSSGLDIPGVCDQRRLAEGLYAAIGLWQPELAAGEEA